MTSNAKYSKLGGPDALLTLQPAETSTHPQSSILSSSRSEGTSDGSKTQSENNDAASETWNMVNADADSNVGGSLTPEKQKKQKDIVTPGSLTSFTTIYQVLNGKTINWSKEIPKDAMKPAEDEESAKHAIVVRNKTSSDSRRQFEAESIVIQSQWLKTALGEILKGYPGVSCQLSRLEFSQPFQPFLHRWPQLVAYLERKDLDEKTLEHMRLLHSFLSEELAENIKALADYISHGVTTYEHAWMIFQAGTLAVSASKGPLSVYEVVKTQYNEKCGRLEIQTDVVHWDGAQFGRHTEYLLVPRFRGVEKITSLPVFPLALHESKDLITARLIQRGKKFQALAGYTFRQYHGTAITWNNRGERVPAHHSGRIAVDGKFYNNFASWERVNLNPFKEEDKAFIIEEAPFSSTTNNDGPKFHLKDELLLLCSNMVRGYSFTQKRWLGFFVDIIEEIKWNTAAFDLLVLPEDQKELILAFTESQVENRENFDDVIQGKGQGIIILLSGKPGIGKTLTAETVAEQMKRPLFTIASGDLGDTMHLIESKLTVILQMSARWHSVLLLDECDVYLEARSNNSLERNALVSTFLRTLEYYQGILFMTTNRADNIDPAFESRVHVAMQYPDLTTSSRRKIWGNFLEKTASDDHELSDADLNELAEMHLNGRQIKNILKTSRLLANRKKQPLKREFINTVLAIRTGQV